MKPQRCYLICFTRWGYPCYRNHHDSKSDALKTWRKMRDDGYAFSYHLFSEDKKHILKKGV